jgi:hypothetical protein
VQSGAGRAKWVEAQFPGVSGRGEQFGQKVLARSR